MVELFNNMAKLKIVFFGTPEFAVPTLEALAHDERFEVVLIVTNPDAHTGRKQEFVSSPVCKVAFTLGIPIFKPESLKNNDVVEFLTNAHADYFVVLAYGKIFPKNILDIPKIGCINVHGSLLPKYRGASPVQSALMAGDTQTGITIILMNEKMDEGDILEKHTLPIEIFETTETLMKKLSIQAATYLPETLKNFAEGAVLQKSQNNNLATYTKKLQKEDGYFNPLLQNSENILWKWKGVTPWPSLFTFVDHKRMKLLSISLSNEIVQPGLFLLKDNRLFIGTKKGSLEILSLHIEGKRAMNASEYCSGLQGRMPIWTE